MTYPTLADLRQWVGVTDVAEDDTLTAALAAAVGSVEAWCGRKFTSSAPATRTMRACHARRLLLPAGHDIASTSGLVVATDDNDDGTAETTWTIGSDFVVDPFDGVGPDGASGWPVIALDAVGSRTWPVLRRPSVAITATWGWSAVPDDVRHATLLIAQDLWSLKNAAFGVAGYGEFGPVRVGENRRAAALLDRFRHPMAMAVVA